ncbi:MAG TPA: histidine ammonia-lyase [Vicinamibacterales bacterium]|nr:histidine ammonia-lyase [Vicinamibacterales bacterium]
MILLNGNDLSLKDLLAIADDRAEVGLAPEARARVAASRAVVEEKAEGSDAVYGVNTGFGNFAETRIDKHDLAKLQLNLLRSHAAGVDTPLPVRTVRAAMALRVNVLAKGFSGIRVETVEALIAMLNRGVHPRVPSRGSVGASGDLAPLAHLALVLVGEGEALDQGSGIRDQGSGIGDQGSGIGDQGSGIGHQGSGIREPGSGRIAGGEALRKAGLSPVTLGAKEGLALINGTQVSTAVLALALADAERLSRAADISAALSIDALMGSMHPFEARIHEPRPFAGQAASADNLLRLLDGSGINASHVNCGRVQDAYSMRCAPQVHGAAREALSWIRHIVTVEMNAATDNPMVFPRRGAAGGEEGEIVSGGNFHGAPLALAADLLVMAVAQLATISERRSERLVNPALSGLPAFLTQHGGLQSGLMIAQVTAAALTSEIKTLSHPASVDTIPTSANKEDHVSMSMHASLKAERALQFAINVIAVEILCACQAIDLHAPLKSSPPLMRAHKTVRARVPTLVDDRPPAPDLDAIAQIIRAGELEYATGIIVN